MEVLQHWLQLKAIHISITVHQIASESGLKVGHGHEYAKLQLDFNGNTKVLTSYAD